MAKHKRKIVLVLSRDGSKHTLETDAKTLGELKAAAAAAGINTDGLIWYEGLNRIFLKDADAVLPEGGNYKGSYTTNLLFHLGRANEQHSFGADYVNDRTGEVEATFPIKRGRTLRVTKEELQNLRQCIQEESAQSITTAQRHPVSGQPQKYDFDDASRIAAVYSFCIDTNVISESITPGDFMDAVGAADLKSIYDAGVKKHKFRYVIYVLAQVMDNNQWYSEAARSINCKPAKCSGATVSFEWKEEADKFKKKTRII